MVVLQSTTNDDSLPDYRKRVVSIGTAMIIVDSMDLLKGKDLLLDELDIFDFK